MRRFYNSEDPGDLLSAKFVHDLPKSPGASIDIMNCDSPCPTLPENGSFFTTYFFYSDTIHEVYSNTWLSWTNSGSSYAIESTDNVMFPGIPHGITAVTKVEGDPNQIVFFKGRQYYLYDMTTKTLTNAGNVALC